ncbi:E3 ubiquitin-protein ligase DMA2 [Paramyrothecium foliicola]|nr:E3 ubiquitin-protein ligase DMA2 [Paramyrothecium foliicola]
MFTQPLASPPGLVATSPVSPSRPSRLRGLSYLRNYTHNHLLSRDSNHSGNTSGTTSPSGQPPANALTRSISYTPTTNNASSEHAGISSSSSNSSSNAGTGNRLTLVSSTPTQPQSSVSQRAAPTARPNAGPTVDSGDHPLEDPSADSTSAPSSDPTTAQPRVEETSDESSDMTRNRAATSGDAAATVTNSSNESVPSIRFSAYYDPRSTRPSLSFPPITRTLPTGSEVIRVGRYSERDSQLTSNTPGNQPSAAPVGFKSKVVSRRHCEFWHEDGKWYIRDVKSSSGTFLNHIRLSPPSQESKAFPVNDGDIVQLGIDFKGGEEMIFRCVKMRLELNRGWQNKLNTFNMAAHKRLRTMANNGASASSSNTQDCSICLNSIAPCQSLFVAPCSHTWHFKCVRSLLTSPQYPIFICPNCRAGADLEADVDEPSEEWERLEEEEAEMDDKPSPSSEQPAATGAAPAETEDSSVQDGDAMEVTVHISPSGSPNGTSSLPPPSAPVPINNSISGTGRAAVLRDSRTPSPPGLGPEGPITPRNDAGPWVFDGSAVGTGGDTHSGLTEMHSLDAAADMDINRTVIGDSGAR